MRDGSQAKAQLEFSWSHALPTLVINGRKYENGARIGVGYLVLVVLPFCLVILGGLLGGIFGAIGSGLNRTISLSIRPWWFKVPLMLLVTITAFALYAGLAALIYSARNP